MRISLERLEGFADEESFRKAGWVVSRRDMQSVAEQTEDKQPPCYSQCPSCSCTAGGAVRAGLSSLQNTLALISW